MLPIRQSGLTVVVNATYPYEADLARAYLESEGIDAWVLDEHQVRMTWHLAHALGGVKVAVRHEDAARALELLGQDHGHLVDALPEAHLEGTRDEHCPRCGSGDTTSRSERRWPTAVQWLASLTLAVAGFFLPQRRSDVHRSCASCGHAWSRTERR